MKKSILVCGVAIVAMLSACSNNSESLSTGTVEDLVETMLENTAQNQGVIPIQVGYYELNNMEARYLLSRLSAAGLITYSVECYDWWNKILQINSYWGESFGTTNYSEEKHVMVKVELTDEGKKLVVESAPKPKQLVDEEMKQPEINLEDYPENKITRENYQKTFENWPKVPSPEGINSMYLHRDESTLAAEVEETQNEYFENLENYFEDNNEYLKQVEKYKKDSNYEVLSMDIQTSTNYERAKTQEKKEKVILKAYNLEIEKARYIRTYNTDEGLCAKAEIIVKYTDVTPVCRAWQQIYEGYRLCSPVHLIYFNDKGWMLQDEYLNFEKTSSMDKSMMNLDYIDASVDTIAAIINERIL